MLRIDGNILIMNAISIVSMRNALNHSQCNSSIKHIAKDAQPVFSWLQSVCTRSRSIVSIGNCALCIKQGIARKKNTRLFPYLAYDLIQLFIVCSSVFFSFVSFFRGRCSRCPGTTGTSCMRSFVLCFDPEQQSYLPYRLCFVQFPLCVPRSLLTHVYKQTGMICLLCSSV